MACPILLARGLALPLDILHVVLKGVELQLKISGIFTTGSGVSDLLLQGIDLGAEILFLLVQSWIVGIRHRHLL